jgi:hypothetical protein
MLPPGECFEFMIDADKLDKFRQVIAHSGGDVAGESRVGKDVRLRVSKRDGSESH